jgi:hypothetical protein
LKKLRTVQPKGGKGTNPPLVFEQQQQNNKKQNKIRIKDEEGKRGSN